MKHEVLQGQVDYSVIVFIPDPASTDGSGKTGLVAANLTVSGVRVETDNDVTVTDYTGSLNNLASLTAAHADWGLLEVSATLAPGLYRLDIADAIFAAGAWSAVVYVMITSSAAAPAPMEFVLVAFNPFDGVRLGLTALPNAAAEAAGGLFTRGSGAGQINQPANGIADVNLVRWLGTAAAAPATAGVPKVAIEAAGDFAQAAADKAWSTAARTLTAFGFSVTVGTNNDKTGYGLSAAAVQAIWDALTAALTTVGSIGKLLVDRIDATISSRSTYAGGDTAGTTTLLTRIPGVVQPQTGDSFARLGAPANLTVSADIAADKAVDDAIKLKTDLIPAVPAAVGSAMTLTSGERDAIADAHLDRANAIETGLTPRGAHRLEAASAAAKLAGAATATVTIRNAVADSKDRIVATVDASGNRTAVTTDVT